MGHARCLVNMESDSECIEMMKRIIDKALSVRQVEELMKQSRQQKQPKETKKKSLPEFHVRQKDLIASKLETKVEITRSQRGKGKLTIEFKNDKEFERIAELLSR